jgi:hypothetical protein
MMIRDYHGQPLTIGDLVRSICVDVGAPLYAHRGIVRARVQWSAVSYSDLTPPYHSVVPTAIVHNDSSSATRKYCRGCQTLLTFEDRWLHAGSYSRALSCPLSNDEIGIACDEADGLRTQSVSVDAGSS